jgi:cytochrome c
MTAVLSDRMRQWHFIKLLARPTSSRRDLRVGHWNRAFLIMALSGMAYMLSSPSALPQASQGTEGISGQQAFNNVCRTCHVVREGDNRLGPNLYKIIGRKAGSLPDYAFSSAMKEAGFVWDEEKLDRFIANADEVVPGNSMKPYGGVPSSDDRKKIIAFLSQPR